MIEKDRKTINKYLTFNNIKVSDKYSVKEPIIDVNQLNVLINNIIIDSYNEVKKEFDIEKVKEITFTLTQRIDNMPPTVNLSIIMSTWETKKEIYNRRAYEKIELEKKIEKLEREASLIGYKLDKL